MTDFLKPSFKRDPASQSADRGIIDVRVVDEIRRRVNAAANGQNSGIAAVSILGNIPGGETVTIPSGVTLSVAGNEYSLDIYFVIQAGAVLEIGDCKLLHPITGAGRVVATKVDFSAASAVAIGNITEWSLIECILPAVITTDAITDCRISGTRYDGYAAIACGQITESRLEITGTLTSPGPIRSSVHLVGNWVAFPDLGLQSSVIAWNVTSGGGTGTVTSVSVATANGLAGTVANPTTTPAITLSTTVNGLLQGNGTAISAATVGTGLSFAGGTLSNTQIGLTDGDKGDITVASSGTSWTVDANAITNTKLADMATATLKGRATAGTGDPEDLTGTQATALLDVFTSSLKGLAPASGGGTTNFLRADGTWAAPPDDIPYSVAPAIAVTGGSVITYDGYIVRPLNISGSGSFTVDTAGVPDGAIMTLMVESVSGTALIETDGYVSLHAREWLPESAGEILTLQYVASLGYWAETSRSITYDSSAGFLAKNGSGVTIPRGTVVYISGATGNNPLILPADFSSEATSAGTVGMVYDDIPNNEFGHVITVGIVRNVNTFGIAAGAPVYLGAAGAFTNIKPSAPNHIVKVGNVVRTSATVGTIQVQISNGWELDELHDVDIDSPAKGNLLVRNGSNLWQNFAAGGDGYVLAAASTEPTGLTWSRIIGLTDGNKGSITVSGDGSTWLLNNNTVTNNELADMLNNRIKGRIGSIPGDPQDLTGTEVTTLLDTFTSTLKGLAPASGGGTTNFLRADGTWAAPPNSGGTVTSVSVVSANGLAGTVANATTTPAITLSTSVTGLLQGNGTAISAATIGTGLSFAGGTLSNTQIGLTDGDKGDITVASSGASWTVDANAITNSKLADMPTAAFKGRVSAGTGDPEDLTGTQATTLLDTFTSTLKGLAPASGGGTTNFLRADGTWAAPAGTSGGTVTDVSVVTANGLAGTVANSTTTPAITLSTTVTGLLKGNGTAISAAVSGVDYAPAGNYVTLDTVQTITETKSIDVSSTAAALRITQAGTGEALRVEDSTNPDSTPFVVTSAGYVGVGTAAPSKKVHIRDSGLLIDGASSVDSAPFAARLIVDSGASTGHTLADLRNNNGSRLFVGGSTVGIGTATPLAALDLASGQFAIPDGTAAAPAIAFRDDLNTGIFSPTNDIFGIAVNGSEAVRVLESGSTPVMLIGTSTVYGAITVDSNSASGTAGAVMLGHANAGTVLQESYRGGQFAGVRSRGTKAAPTGVASGDGLVNMIGAGVTSAGGINYGALITMKAAETFTSTASGGRIEFHTTLSGTDGFTTLGGAGTARMIISPDDVTIQPPDDLVLVPGDALIGIGSTITLTAGATATVSGTTSVSLNTSAQKVETTTTAINIEAASAGADIAITAADGITNTIGDKSQFKVVEAVAGDLSTIDFQKILNTIPTRGPDGSAAAPSYSFSGGTGTGMWRSGKALNFAVDGYTILSLNQNAAGDQIQSVPDGTAARPAYTWFGATDTGFFYDATDTYVGLSIGGTRRLLLDATGMTSAITGGPTIPWGAGTASAPTYAFFGDGDTGMYRPSANQVAFSTGGDIALLLDASAVTSSYTPSIITNDTGMAVGHNSSSRTLTLNTASTPRVTIAGNGDYVEIDSALVYEPGATVSLTADNQAVTVGARSYMKISSNSGTSTARTFTISNGVRTGHVLIIHCIAGAAEILDTGNMEIAGTMTFNASRTLSLIWSGSTWVETARAL